MVMMMIMMMTNSLRVVAFVQQTMNATDRELETSTT